MEHNKTFTFFVFHKERLTTHIYIYIYMNTGKYIKKHNIKNEYWASGADL